MKVEEDIELSLCFANPFMKKVWDELQKRGKRIVITSDMYLPLSTIEKMLHIPSGLVLITGPSGSGKTTTLASMIAQINRTRACHIMTIEDPIEYVFRRDKAMIHQREVGTDVESFSTALRSSLREDPDIILVGEMRDLETITAAINAAETGHLVFSTLHTSSAVQTIDRIIDAVSANPSRTWR